jgi:hypothetical protein
VYEHRSHPVLSRRRFVVRLLSHAAFSIAFILVSLGIGIWGYEHYEHLALPDAFVNAAMLMGGMGPIDTQLSEPGKWFAGIYSLYAGLVLLVAVGVVGTPVIHRLLHRLHMESPEEIPAARHQH